MATRESRIAISGILDEPTGVLDALANLTDGVNAGVRQGNRSVFLGNSIAAANGSAITTPGSGWVGILSIVSNGRVRPVGWAATGGHTTANMLARFDADVLPSKPDFVFIQEITNDVASLTFAQTKANFAAIWSKCRGIGSTPIVVGPLPRGPYASEISKRARWVQEECRRRNITYIDLLEPLINPLTGAIAAAYDTGDGVHPNSAGHDVIGRKVWEVVAPLFPPNYAAPLATYNTDPLNLIPNGMFVDDNADGTATGWIKTGTGVATVEAGTGEVLGNWQVLTVSSAAANYMLRADITTGFAAGDTLLFTGRVDHAPVAGMLLSVRIDANSTGNVAGGYWQITPDIDGRFAREIIVPSGVTTLRPFFGSTAVGTGVMKVAQLSLRNLTAEAAAS